MSNPEIVMQWGLACAGVLTQMHEADHRWLGGRAPSADATAECAKILSSWWGVTSAAELAETLDWLRDDGHRAAWDELAEELRDFGLDPDDAPDDDDDEEEAAQWRQKQLVAAWAPRIGARSLIAWDAGRLVSVVGWAFHARLIDPASAWAEILGAARKLQSTHASWSEVGQLYALGKQFWRGGADPELDRAVHALLSSPTSPWVQLPWNVSLVLPGVSPRAWE